MESKFTKGVFHAVNYAGVWNIQGGEFYGDDNILDSESVGVEEAEANAKLIAAAPDLLKMLIKISNIENHAFSLNGFDLNRLKSEVNQAIKKATS